VDHTAVEQILSLLAFAGLAAVALTWVGALLEYGGVGRLGSTVSGLVDRAETGLALVVALTATAGSLYFSESVGYIPCVLCWFQRIAMYPLVILLLVALVRRERAVAPYGIAVCAAGLTVSIYHYQLEWFPDQASVCSKTASVPCSVVWFKQFGVSTIPFLAGAAFLMIGTLLALARHNERRAVAEESEGAAAVEEAPERGLLAEVAVLVVVGAVAAGAAVLALAGHESPSGSDSGQTETTSGPAGNATAGRVVFAETGCGGCHTFSPAGSTSSVGPSLDGSSLSEAEIASVVANGRGAMPGLAAQLSEQQIADVAAFVHAGSP
jgi:disulfide bond formation protein DsbB